MTSFKYNQIFPDFFQSRSTQMSCGLVLKTGFEKSKHFETKYSSFSPDTL